MPRTAKALTDTAVKNARPLKGQTGWRDISDGAVPGLKLRVSPKSEKVFSFVSQVGKKRRRHELGAYPALSLADARERARELKAAAAGGMSPEEYERKVVAENMTLATAHATYLEAVASGLKPNWLGLKRKMFEHHVPDTLAHKPIKDIQRLDVADLGDRIAKRGYPTQANRVQDEVMACLRWCADQDLIASVPTLGRRSRQPESPRDRTLTDAELGDLWKHLGDLTSVVEDFVRLLILTGQRRDEVREIHSREIDARSRIWTIPADRYKTGRAHTVPLPDGAWEVIERRMAEVGDGYLLPHRDGPEKPWNGTRNAMEQVRRKVLGKTDYTLHDIRRTVRTGLVRINISEVVAERVIGHEPQGIVKVYDRYDRLDERRRALEAWERQVRALAGEGASNVVQLERAAS
jgi:integrase